MKTLRTLVAVVAAGVMLSGCGTSSYSASTSDEETMMETAWAACDDGTDGVDGLDLDTEVFRLGDAGHTLTISGAKEDQYVGMVCFLVAFATPDRILSAIDSTTSLMGRQSDESDDYKYEWSYHPDNGMDLIISDE